MKSFTSVVVLILSLAVCLILISQANCYQDSNENEDGLLDLEGNGKCFVLDF